MFSQSRTRVERWKLRGVCDLNPIFRLIEAGTVSPEEGLAGAVLLQALTDWTHHIYRAELLAFFQSTWFTFLTDVAGINASYMRKCIQRDSRGENPFPSLDEEEDV